MPRRGAGKWGLAPISKTAGMPIRGAEMPYQPDLESGEGEHRDDYQDDREQHRRDLLEVGVTVAASVAFVRAAGDG